MLRRLWVAVLLVLLSGSALASKVITNGKETTFSGDSADSWRFAYGALYGDTPYSVSVAKFTSIGQTFTYSLGGVSYSATVQAIDGMTAPPVTCTAPQVRDDATNTCVTAPPVSCTAPQVRDDATNTCFTPATCPEGSVHNEAYQCVTVLAWETAEVKKAFGYAFFMVFSCFLLGRAVGAVLDMIRRG